MMQVWKNIKYKILIFTLLTIVLSIMMVSEALILEWLLDVIQLSNLSYYIMVVIFIAIFFVIQSIVYYFQQYLTSKLSHLSVYEYRKIIFNRISHIALSELNKGVKGKGLSYLTSQMDRIKQQYFFTMFWGSYLFIQFIMAFIVALVINPLMALAVTALSIPNLLIAFIFKNKLEKNQEILFNENTEYVKYTEDLINGERDWRVTNSQEEVLQEFEKHAEELYIKQKKVDKTQYFVTTLNNFFSNFLYFGVWIVGGFFILFDHIDLASVVAFTQLVTRIAFPLYSSSDMIAQYINGKHAVKMIDSAFSIEEKGELSTTIETITFDSIQLPSELTPLKPISLTLHSGKHYLIKGASGIGKTRLLETLTKEINEYKGTVSINQKDVRSLDTEWLYRHIAYIPQHPHIFIGTILDNLTVFSKSYTLSDIQELLGKIGLGQWQYDEILHRMIGEGFWEISGGEIKRLALARALLRKPDVLIVDEFSSGIDQSQLKTLEEEIFKFPGILLYITHVADSDTELHFDEIIDLNSFV